jgi:hypothetical protein
MTATDPTPQPATHASGPLAGQPVTPTPVEQLVEHIAHHRPPGRPVVDCQWCPEPEPEQAPVVVLEDALCRRVWAAALRYGAAHLATIGLSRGPDALRDLADHIDAGAVTPWADPPEPPATPAQPAGDATAAAGPTPEPTGPAALDLDAIVADHLRQCGPCDFGLVEMRCNCPTGDPRVAISRLVAEVRRLHVELVETRTEAGHMRDRIAELDAPAAPDDQRRCPVAHPAHGQCELYQGHRPAGDPDRRHRTGALEWLTDAEIRACALPPLASYAGTADLQSGPANASESAGGPGWDRETIVGLADGLAAEVRGTGLISPERVVKLRRQVLALLADRDLLAGRDRALRVEAEISNGLRVDLAEVTESEIRARAEVARLTAELEHAKADRQDLWDTRDKRGWWAEAAAETRAQARDA